MPSFSCLIISRAAMSVTECPAAARRAQQSGEAIELLISSDS
jgi:hypothetical protein